MNEGKYLAYGTKTRIREFVRRDVDHWLAWARHDDPLLEAYNPPTMSAGMSDAWFQDLVDRQGQLPFAVDTADSPCVGRIFLRHQHNPPGSATLGMDFDPRFMDQGYGTDALRAFLDYYFDVLRFDRMYLSVAVFNRRAQHVYQRLGFTRVNEHWDRARTSAPVLRDPRYRDIAGLFRRGPRGLEGLHWAMVLNRARFIDLKVTTSAAADGEIRRRS